MRTGKQLPKGSSPTPRSRVAALACTALLALSALAFAACGEESKTSTSSSGSGTADAKKLFNQNCSSCHTLAAAGASGSFGPNLDELKPSESAVAAQERSGGGGMPSFKGQLSDKQIQAIAAYVADNAGK